jgi:hypothetical protein
MSVLKLKTKNFFESVFSEGIIGLANKTGAKSFDAFLASFGDDTLNERAAGDSIVK